MDFIINQAVEKSEGMQMADPVSSVGQATIKVIGAGGAGKNMVNWLYNKSDSGRKIN